MARGSKYLRTINLVFCLLDLVITPFVIYHLQPYFNPGPGHFFFNTVMWFLGLGNLLLYLMCFYQIYLEIGTKFQWTQREPDQISRFVVEIYSQFLLVLAALFQAYWTLGILVSIYGVIYAVPAYFLMKTGSETDSETNRLIVNA